MWLCLGLAQSGQNVSVTGPEVLERGATNQEAIIKTMANHACCTLRIQVGMLKLRDIALVCVTTNHDHIHRLTAELPRSRAQEKWLSPCRDLRLC